MDEIELDDVSMAIKRLEEGDCTCVFAKDGAVAVSGESGISPLLDAIEHNYDLRGAAVADKILGKASALLMVYAGVRYAFGSVMSLSAWQVLSDNGVEYYFAKMTDKIMNRQGTGVCPMEQTVENITDPAEAYSALLKKRAELRGENR